MKDGALRLGFHRSAVLHVVVRVKNGARERSARILSDFIEGCLNFEMTKSIILQKNLVNDRQKNLGARKKIMGMLWVGYVTYRCFAYSWLCVLCVGENLSFLPRFWLPH